MAKGGHYPLSSTNRKEASDDAITNPWKPKEMHQLKGDVKVRDEIKKEFEQREASAPAWWVPLLPAAACIGVALVIFVLSFFF